LLQIILIALGGAVGSVLRYLVSSSTYALCGRDFPYGTLVVNVVGSFLIGFLSIILLERFADMAAELRSLLIIGFLGGFTTFSSFSVETLSLFENGEVTRAVLNVGLSVCICLLVTWLGILLGRHL
jgi:CrcB protein